MMYEPMEAAAESFYGGDPAEAPPKRGNRKDRRRWCKGVEGRKHQIETVGWPIADPIMGGGPGTMCPRGYICDHCMVCGKVMRIRLDDTGGTR